MAKLWSGATATTIRQGSNQMSLFWGKAVADTALWGKHVSGRPGVVLALMRLPGC